MLHSFLSLMIAAWFALLPQATPEAKLEQPLPGQALQGVVSLSGTTAIDGYVTAQIEFRFENDPAQTWFLIQDGIPAIQSNVLASWDTTTLTDGVYRLRLSVIRADGGVATAEVAGVRVRNYSAIETNTPEALPEVTRQPSVTPTATAVVVRGTPTPPPANPAAVTGSDLRASASRGLVVMAGLFLMITAYLGLRRLGRR